MKGIVNKNFSLKKQKTDKYVYYYPALHSFSFDNFCFELLL